MHKSLKACLLTAFLLASVGALYIWRVAATTDNENATEKTEKLENIHKLNESDLEIQIEMGTPASVEEIMKDKNLSSWIDSY